MVPGDEGAEGAGHPAVLVEGAAAVVVEELLGVGLGRIGVGEGGGEALAVDVHLFVAVHYLRRGDAEDFVEGGSDVGDVGELRAHRLVRLDALRPRDDKRVAGAAEVGGDELGAAERGRAGPCPARVIHVVSRGRAEGVEAAEAFEGFELLLDGVGDVVLREQFADGAELSFGARAVVAPDVEDDGIVAEAAVFKALDEAADLAVGVLDESGEEFHAAALEGALVFRDVFPTPAWSHREA